MISITIAAIALVVAFGIGMLVGNGFTTLAQEAKSRRQAEVQRQINAQLQELRAWQERDLERQGR